MDAPNDVTVADGAFATDGGSISLVLTEPGGRRHTLLLTQHLLPRWDPNGPLLGRIYFDGELVPVRSEAEARLLKALRTAGFPEEKPRHGRPPRGSPGMVVGEDIKAFMGKVEEGPTAALRHLVESVLRYVESDDYVAFAAGQGEPPGA